MNARPDFGLATTQRDGCAVVSITGEIDTKTAVRVQDEVLRLVHDGQPDVVLDLEAVEFLDSGGLGAFVGAMRNLCDRGGRVLIASPTPAVTRMLEISGITGLVPVVIDLNEAERRAAATTGD